MSSLINIRPPSWIRHLGSAILDINTRFFFHQIRRTHLKIEIIVHFNSKLFLFNVEKLPYVKEGHKLMRNIFKIGGKSKLIQLQNPIRREKL